MYVESEKIITNYENAIYSNFYGIVKAFVEVLVDKNGITTYLLQHNNIEINRKNVLYQMRVRIRRIINACLFREMDSKLNLLDHQIINFYNLLTNKFMPSERLIDEISGKILFKLELKSHSFKYLLAAVKLQEYTEYFNGKLYKLFPSTSSLIPGHITINTPALVSISRKLFPLMNTLINENNVWDFIFKISNSKIFKKKRFNFNNIIQTDGVSISIQFSQVVQVEVNNT